MQLLLMARIRPEAILMQREILFFCVLCDADAGNSSPPACYAAAANQSKAAGAAFFLPRGAPLIFCCACFCFTAAASTTKSSFSAL